MKYCPKCGFNLDTLGDEIRKKMNFCPECKFSFKKTEPTALPENKRDESFYIRLLQEQKYIEAVKEHRLATGSGLKEAKEYIDRLAEKNHLSVQNTMTDSKKRFWLFMIVSGFLGLMVASAGLAVFPGLGLITQPFFGGELTASSSSQYTPAGQSGLTEGSSLTFYHNGKDVFLLVFFYSFLIYSLIIFLLFYLRHFIRKTLKDRRTVV